MASLIANIWNRLCSKQTPVTIMLIGLDNSGKTSVLNSLRSYATSSSSSHQSQSSSLSSSVSSQSLLASTSRQNDIQQHQQQQQQQQKLPSESRVTIGQVSASNTDTPTERVEDISLDDDEGLLVSGGEEDFCKQESLPLSTLSPSTLSPRPLARDQTFKLVASGSNKRADCDNYLPTIGYNFERIQYKGTTVNVLDFSGQSKYRGLWQEFYNCVDAIVFVIDSSDMIRLVVVRDELENTLNHPYFSTLQQPDSSSNSSNSSNSEIDALKHNSNNDDTKVGSFFNGNNGTRHSTIAFDLVQKQLTISQGKLIQSPLDRSGFKKHTSNNRLPDTTRRHSRQQQQQQQQTVDKSVNNSNGRRAAMGQQWRTSIPILFLANKTDLTNSADTDVMRKTLNLSHLSKSKHPWLIQATSVKTGEGLAEGFDWLLSQLIMTKS